MDSTYRSTLAVDLAVLLTAARGDFQRAARLQCVYETTLNEMSEFSNPYDDRVLADLRGRPRAILGSERYAAAYATGWELSVDQALAETLEWMEQGGGECWDAK